jgi:hypothetical protein
MSRITVDPYIPLALWVPLALAAAGLLIAYALASRRRLSGLRRRVILALMGIAVALPLAVLLNPTWMERVPPPPGKPLLTVLVDASASMDVADAGQGDSRFHEAARIAKAAAAGLKERYEVRLRAFAAESAPTTPQALDARHADGAATDLAAAVDQSMDEERPQGQALLLLSDGIQNVGGSGRLRETMARAKALAVPIYTKVLGGPAEVRDLEVELKRPQEVAFIRQRVPVTVILRQRGSLAARARLQLLLDGKEVEKRWARIVPNGSTEEVFHVIGKTAGLFRYEVRAEPLPGELSAANNTASLLLRVVDQPVRVLLLEGKPYWDTKFLIRSLSLDESVELTAVVQLAPGRLLERNVTRPNKKPAPAAPGRPSPAAPPPAGPSPAASPPAGDQWTIEKDAGKFLADPASLASYQIVILGRRAEVFLSDESLTVLRKWLDTEDGSLVCFRGPPSSEINQRLDDLLPVRWTPSSETRFRAQWTEAGQELHWLPAGEGDALAAMPSLAATARAEPKPYATTVLAASEAAAGQSVPVVAYRPAGALGSGRVVVVEGAGMWRWAFLPPQHQDRDELYSAFWRSLLRWLVTNVGLLPSQHLALRADKATFNTEESASATLLVRENRWTGGLPHLELTGTEMKRPQTVACKPWGNTPGQYHADLGRLAEGRYRLRVAGAGKEELAAETALEVRGSLKERLDVAAQPATMTWIAQQSGGAVLERADPAQIARHFDEHLLRSRPERTVRTTAWDRWWVLAGMFVLWGGSWGLRRWSGLI